MVLHARGEGVPCSSYSISRVGHDQSCLMENSPIISHIIVTSFFVVLHRYLSFQGFSSIQIGSCANQLIQCKVHEIFFSNKSSFAQNAFQLRELCPFSPSLQTAPFWFQHVHLRCLRHSSSRGSPIVSIMDALNRGLDGDPEYSTFLHCKSWTCAQNWWGLATSVLETWICWWWCSKFWAQFLSSSFEFHVLHG